LNEFCAVVVVVSIEVHVDSEYSTITRIEQFDNSTKQKKGGWQGTAAAAAAVASSNWFSNSGKL
jgi:hypothetical protein